MDDADTVGGVERAEDGEPDPGGLGVGQRPAPGECGLQRLALDQLHDDPGKFAVEEYVVNRHGRRMVDLGGGPGLVRQPPHGPPPLLVLRIPGQTGLLDGDVPLFPLALLIASPPHRAVRPGADPLDEPVTPTDQTSVGRVFAVFTHGT